jgi:hypothetical protein
MLHHMTRADEGGEEGGGEEQTVRKGGRRVVRRAGGRMGTLAHIRHLPPGLSQGARTQLGVWLRGLPTSCLQLHSSSSSSTY